MVLKLGNTTIAGATIQLGQPLNIGQIVQSTLPLTDAGLHLLDGALIQGSGIYSAFVTYITGLVSTHPDLFATEANWQSAVATYGVCGKFVYDSVNNTVRLPKITGIVEGTTDLTALGDLVAAGLPNITGTLTSDQSPVAYYGGTGTGALSILQTRGSTYVGTSGGGNRVCGLDFNASRSNSIYGNSNTVQPQTIKVLYYIVIATSTKTDIEVDIDKVATDLNGKADTDLTNLTSTATPNFDSRWVASSYTVYSNTSLSSSGNPGVYSTSLASYLPNDGYNYEVLFRVNTDTSNTYNVMVHTDFAGNHGQIYNASNYGNRAQELILLFGATRTLTLSVYTSVDHFSVYAVAYRRIGTNA